MPRLLHTDWPAHLWIVRHGQSAGNVARDAAELAGDRLIELEHRDADTPLSTLGERQAVALAQWFSEQPASARPSVFFSSPFVRAYQTCVATATALGHEASDIAIDERLREKEFGILDRYTVPGIKATFPELAEQRALVGKFYFRPPGGESWCDVILRLRSVLEVLRRDHVGEHVLIVAHQVIVNCFRYLLECLDEQQILDIDREADVPNCGITHYQLAGTGEGARFELESANLIVPHIAQLAEITKAPDTPAGPK